MRFIFGWLRTHRTSVILALSLGLLFLSAWYLLAPTSLTIAVMRPDSDEAGTFAAYAQALEQQKKEFRLRVKSFSSYRETAQALERGDVDLALVRPDILYPANGLTIALMREEALMVIAPSAKKIDSVAGLSGKRVGVVARDDTDVAIVEAVLNYYSGLAGQIRPVRILPTEIEVSGLARSMDALAFVATPRTEDAQRVVKAATNAFGRDVSSVSLEGLEPLTIQNPAFREMTVASGDFSLSPKLPKEEIKTAGVSYRLVGSDQLDRIPIAKLVQYLFEMRPRVAREYPSVNLMKQPPSDAEMSAALPNHRGAVDYFNREQQTIMDRWGDWLWLALFAAGGLTSVIAWLRQQFVRQRQEVIDKVLDRLVAMISEARAASTAAELEALADETDGLVTHAVRHARWRTTSPRTMSALIIALDAVRAVMGDRRRELASGDPKLVPEHSAHLGRADESTIA
jgi:TRAP-type uncharacterized transport system substrate-binding protein